ncbi:MAG: hypothetical protein N2691_05400 [Patescibacteria group bacterium]|nr:hypothetical protein [Patescibacteria group bacterium]
MQNGLVRLRKRVLLSCLPVILSDEEFKALSSEAIKLAGKYVQYNEYLPGAIQAMRRLSWAPDVLNKDSFANARRDYPFLFTFIEQISCGKNIWEEMYSRFPDRSEHFYRALREKFRRAFENPARAKELLIMVYNATALQAFAENKYVSGTGPVTPYAHISDILENVLRMSSEEYWDELPHRGG